MVNTNSNLISNHTEVCLSRQLIISDDRPYVPNWPHIHIPQNPSRDLVPCSVLYDSASSVGLWSFQKGTARNQFHHPQSKEQAHRLIFGRNTFNANTIEKKDARKRWDDATIGLGFRHYIAQRVFNVIGWRGGNSAICHNWFVKIANH